MNGGYELIRCHDCHHERVRPAERQIVRPCPVCDCEDLEVFDLVAVERDDRERYVPTPEGIALFAELQREEVLADAA